MMTIVQGEVVAALVGVMEAVEGLLARPDGLGHPEAVAAATDGWPLGAAWGALAAGVVLVSHGLRVSRPALGVVALLAGAWGGYRLGEPLGGEIVLAMCCGLLLAVLAWPATRLLGVALAAVVGALVLAHACSIGVTLVTQQVMSDRLVWLVAVWGLVMAGAAALVRWEAAVIVAGAGLMAIGLTAIALHGPDVRDSAIAALAGHRLALPAAVAVTGAGGVIMQWPGPRDGRRAAADEEAEWEAV